MSSAIDSVRAGESDGRKTVTAGHALARPIDDPSRESGRGDGRGRSTRSGNVIRSPPSADAQSVLPSKKPCGGDLDAELAAFW